MESGKTTVSKVKIRQKLGYGLGHVFNDLSVAMWSTYTLLFYSKVLHFDNKSAGVVMLVGQVTDGIASALGKLPKTSRGRAPRFFWREYI